MQYSALKKLKLELDMAAGNSIRGNSAGSFNYPESFAGHQTQNHLPTPIYNASLPPLSTGNIWSLTGRPNVWQGPLSVNPLNIPLAEFDCELNLPNYEAAKDAWNRAELIQAQDSHATKNVSGIYSSLKFRDGGEIQLYVMECNTT